MKTELLIYDVTLYEPKNRRSLIRSGTSDTTGTERIVQQIKNEINQNRRLLLWLNVVVVIGDKRVKLTQWGGGISIRNIESFSDVLGKLREMGEKLIEAGKSHEFFSNTEIAS